jgi:hypothetical protein
MNSRRFIDHFTPAAKRASGVNLARLVNNENIRTPQCIENRACNDPGILTTDTKPISGGLPSVRVMCLERSVRN